VWTIHLAQ